MRMIQLSKINRDAPRASQFSDTDEPGENGQVPVEGEPTTPVVVNAEAIRCFYARRDNRPGTRLTFVDGGGFAVSEAPEQVQALIAAA